MRTKSVKNGFALRHEKKRGLGYLGVGERDSGSKPKELNKYLIASIKFLLYLFFTTLPLKQSSGPRNGDSKTTRCGE
jgi:hypothetical protein